VFTTSLRLQTAAHAGAPFGSANAAGDSVGEWVSGNILLDDVVDGIYHQPRLTNH